MHSASELFDLNNLRVLVVEDEYYLADDLAQAITRSGAEVVGPVGSLQEAEAIVDVRQFDVAVLDMNLRGRMAHDLADRLRDAGVPFLLTTGYNESSIPERFRDVPRIEKPFNVELVVQSLGSVTAS